MKYYQPTFKIEAIISAETKEEALEKAKTVELDVEELPNIGVWRLELKDGTSVSANRIEFWGDHNLEIGMTHEFVEHVSGVKFKEKYYTGKLVKIVQDRNRFWFVCEQI